MANHNRQAFAAARAALPLADWHRLLGKAAIAGLVAIGFVWLLANRMSGISLHATGLHLFAVAPGQWLTAILATAASFWAVGHYDGVIHRYLATGARAADARRAGATAIAISQTIGLGVITGAIVRWRMLPGHSLAQAVKISTLVALFFLSGWAVFTALALAILPHAPFKPVAMPVLILAAALITISAVAPKYRHIPWPNLIIITRLLALTALDTLAAALALWALIPPDLALPFAALLPAFLIAFGAGLISGAPGGVGAFEITFLGLLPSLPEPPLLAAILAWRVVYFAAPALIGAGAAIHGPSRARRPTATPPQTALTKTAPRAEVGLLARPDLHLFAAGYDHAWLAGRTAHCLIGLLDPLSGDPASGAAPCDFKQAIAALMDAAQSESRLPVLYKCTARTAAHARQMGLALRPIAREAWVDPRDFHLNTPTRANLRRKLRRAAAAGITITTAPQNWADLEKINAIWAAQHGGERGFSMGQFDRGYLTNQRIYTALENGAPVAFASFHIGKHEWTLDLMRQTTTAPDGTMHALIAQAIADAAAHALPRLSLAAVPLAALTAAPPRPLASLIHRALGGSQTGLAQFKSAFAPNWQTLYLAAPHRPGLALAAGEIARAVRYPASPSRPAHNLHAEYEIASARQPWQRGDRTTS